MSPGTELLLITEQDAFAKKIRVILSSRDDISLGHVCDGMSELAAYLERAPVVIALVDIDPNPLGILKELDKIAAKYPETHFAVVSSDSTRDLILEAMHAGARHFLLKKFIEPELDRILERLVVGRAARQSSLGSVISVISASGGSGATTVVLNLASELRLESAEPILTIDLDNHYGSVSTYLGITGSYSIADVLTHKGPLDGDLVKTSASSYRRDFQVLVSPASVQHFFSKSIDLKNLPDALEACRQAYKYTIVDAPRISEDVAKLLAGASQAILIVFQLTVKDIKIVQSMMSTLIRFGAKPEKIIPVANRFCRRGSMVPLDETRKALGLDSLSRIRNDFRKVVTCINRGMLLAETNPRSGIRRDFQKLAATISATERNGSH